MYEYDPFEIIQEILKRAMPVADRGWNEMIIDYYVEGGHSAIIGSYTIEKDGSIEEKALPHVADLDLWLRKLQQNLSQAGRPSFTRCKLHLSPDGKYETKYEYEVLDWDALAVPDWSFFPRNKVS